MTTGKDLIDKAAKVCGGYKALAERLEIPAPNVSLMKAGKRAISPATAAELADIAGEDAREAAIDAIIESAKGTRREAVLREILGKAQAAGEAGVLGFSYKNVLQYATESIAINSNLAKRPIHRIYSIISRISSVIRFKVYRASFLQAKKQALAGG